MGSVEGGRTLFSYFTETASKHPNADAVVECDGRKLSYKILSQEVDIFSEQLKIASGQDAFIVLLLPPSIDYIKATLAILSIGKIVVVLHDTYSPQQIQNCLRKLNNPLLLTTRQKLESLIDINYPKCFLMDEMNQILQSQPLTEAHKDPMYDGVGYCFFTSGSTGEPKAVLVTENSMINATLYFAQSEPMIFNCDGRAVVGVTRLSFIACLPDIWNAFFTGGSLYIAPPEVRTDIDKLRSWIQGNGITAMTVATPVFELLMSKDADKMKSLRWITFGGARLNTSKINLKGSTFKTCSAYGGTEFYVAAAAVYPPGSNLNSVTVGKPPTNVELYVLDEERRLVTQPGIRGQLFHSGIGLMRGYLNQPDLTSKVLIPNPFNPQLGLMYASGDFGYWNGNGELVLVGRDDDQVKIHGMRLELGEVEAVIGKYNGMQEVVVQARQVDGITRLVAFCTLIPNAQQPDLTELDNYLRKSLQLHAIPGSFEFLTAFPRTPTGKIDRVDLRNMKLSNLEEANEVESEMTKIVSKIWGEVLELSNMKIRSRDNFFYIGGNSISAFRVVALIQRHTNRNINPQLLFQHPVLKDFVAALDQPHCEIRDTSAIDFEAEATLPNSYQILHAKHPAPTGVLITGATGFLGPCLLLHTLEYYNASTIIYCIVRAQDDKHAKERVLAKLTEFSLGSHSLNLDGIICLAGDLTKENFGMNESDYKKLQDDVGIVFHSAADISFMESYNKLRDSTVVMTKNILRLVMKCDTPKELHYMSTMGVFDGLEHPLLPNTAQTTNETTQGLVVEEAEIPETVNPQRMLNAYFQSKWVSEKLVTEASKRGLTTAIYRIAQVGAHTEFKIANRSDALAGFVITCTQLGIYPELEIRIPFVDADCSQDIIRLSQQKLAMDSEVQNPQFFHIVGDEVKVQDFFTPSSGLKSVSIEDWESEFEDVFGQFENENAVNAWIFMKMAKQAKTSKCFNILKNITLSTQRTKNFQGLKMKYINTKLYTSVLTNQPNL